MEKRGQSLPLNVIVIAIIVVVVLVVLVAYFLGGFGRLGGKVGSTFGTTTAGSDLTLATSACKTLCTQINLFDSPKSSPFCQRTFDVDKNGDGELGQGETEISCSQLVTDCKDKDNKAVSC
ncbi:MAG: hypothetical protein HYS32_01610 [Candidatus Woesearchaeota archaeon]|nr:MAG: hypothetical protein HYS32_01610 [Candidatus Woesearchaeota archaeon]